MSAAMKTLAGTAVGSAMAALVWGIAYRVSVVLVGDSSERERLEQRCHDIARRPQAR